MATVCTVRTFFFTVVYLNGSKRGISVLRLRTVAYATSTRYQVLVLVLVPIVSSDWTVFIRCVRAKIAASSEASEFQIADFRARERMNNLRW
jgi:hypothetical protein